MSFFKEFKEVGRKLNESTTGLSRRKTTKKSGQTSQYVPSTPSTTIHGSDPSNETDKGSSPLSVGAEPRRRKKSQCNPSPSVAVPRRPINTAQYIAVDDLPVAPRIPTSEGLDEYIVETKVAGNASHMNALSLVPQTQVGTMSEPDGLQRKLASIQAAVEEREQNWTSTLKEKDDQIQKQASEIQALLSVQSAHGKEIDELDFALKEERDQTKKLTQAWKRSTAALGVAQRQDASFKIDDKDVEARWQELNYRISNWADTHCDVDTSRLPEAHLKQLESALDPLFSLTPAAQKYVLYKEAQSYLLRSLVMKILVHNIFTATGSGAWWAGAQAQAMQALYHTLLPYKPQDVPLLLKKETLRMTDVKEFSQWKAKSALLLSQRAESSVVSTHIDTLVKKCKDILTPYIGLDESGAWNDLKEVIDKAILLDLDMTKSRSLFAVHDWSAKDLQQLDQTRLETTTGFPPASEGMKVELVLAPCLTKTGNADGDAFDTMIFISNWIVMSRDNRKSMEKSIEKVAG